MHTASDSTFNVLSGTAPNIYSNTSNNVDARDLTSSASVNMRNNYWGTTNASDITSEIRAISYPPNPIVDISDFLDANGDVVPAVNVIQGYIQSDVTLPENTTYEVRGRLEITAGFTLTMSKGATLKFTSNAGLTVYGNLVVQGTLSEPVSFISGRDIPVSRSWNYIDVKDGGNANIDFGVIEHANIGIYFSEGANGTVTNTIIRNNVEGIYVRASSPTIGPDNIITQNNTGIYLTKGTINPVPIINNNKIFDNNLGNGITNIEIGSFNGGRNYIIDVRGNYWGSADASNFARTISNCNASNSSDPCVDYGGYLDIDGNVVGGLSLIGVVQSDLILQVDTTYDVLGYVLVPDGITLTVPSGVNLVFVSKYDNLNVFGNLIVSGVQTNPVVLTSGQTTPAEGYRNFPGDWNGIVVDYDGFVSMEYAVVQYADTGITFYNDASGNISNSVIEYAGTGIYLYNSVNVDINNNLFRYNGIALGIARLSSPIIGPGNAIKQNDIGISLLQASSQNPVPGISGNYIFSNDTYNINVNNL